MIKPGEFMGSLARGNHEPSVRDDEGAETIPKGSTSKWMEVPGLSRRG